MTTAPKPPVISSAGPRHAQRDGFDLHANVAVGAGNRCRLERLCRYVLRPPLAQDALELTAAGRVRLRVRRPWRDGTRAIRFQPSELLDRRRALTAGSGVLKIAVSFNSLRGTRCPGQWQASKWSS